MKTRRDSVWKTKESLEEKAKKLQGDIENYQKEQKNKKSLRDELDKNYEELNAVKEEIIKEQ